MPTTGKTYASEGKGQVYSYDHATNVWTTLPIIFSGASFSVIKVYPYNQDKIVIGGNATLIYSNDGGVTQTISVGDWPSFCPIIAGLCFTNDSNIIYGVGLRIIKSVDGGVSFNTLPFLPGSGGTLGYAIHFANSLLGVASNTSKIFKTTDGGITWVPLYGGAAIDPAFPTDYVYRLHISADGNTIIALTKRSVFRSTDGGTSFTNVFTFGSIFSPIPDLAFGEGNDNYFIITSKTTNMYRSDNAGASWVAFTGQTPVGSPTYSSLYDLYKGFYSYFANISSTTVYQIYEFQETSPGVFSSTLSLTATNEITGITSSFVTVPCYTLTPCTPGGAIITASNDLSAYTGGYVQIDGVCFLVGQSFDCVGSIPITYTSIQSVADCNACNTPEIIYELQDCSNQLPNIYTTETLTPFISGYLGLVIYIQGYPNTCWTVITGNGSTQPVTILNDFSTCPDCIAYIPVPLPPPVYKLENCVTEDILYTLNSQFAQAVDQVVNLVGYPGECWSVTELVFNSQSTTNQSIAVNTQGTLAIYENCPCCLPPVIPPPVKYTRVIPKPDRQFYQITQAQCDIQANVRFADNYHRLFKMLKYGINSMCDNVDLDRVWIKKMQSDLAVLSYPAACIITTPVEPIVCPEPEGHRYIPPTPPPPPPTYSFIVGESPEAGTFGCTTCLDGSTPIAGIICPIFNITLSYDILPTIDPNATYVFSYNGNCVLTLGSFISSGSYPNIPTYAMTSANIVNAGVSNPDPCTSCQ